MGLSPLAAFAGAGFSAGSSSAKFTFDPDVNGGSQLKTLNLNPPPASGAMVSYQLNQSFSLGSATSVAKGSIGYVVNPTTATFTLAPGTGVTQSDPNGDYPGYSRMRIDFDGVFNTTAPSFGPVATGYVSIAVGGNVGAGGSTQFIGQVKFLDASTGTLLRSIVNFNETFSSAGAFAKTFTSSALLGGGTIPTGKNVRVQGLFEFRASNHDGPSEILPFDVDLGGAPPTATFAGGDFPQWNNPDTWRAQGDVEDPDQTIPVIPDGPGQRARFVGNPANVAGGIVLDKTITLGTLDLDSKDDFTFDAGNDGANILNMQNTPDVLIFASRNGVAPSTNNAVIHVRNTSGTNRKLFNTAIEMNDDLDLVVDGSYFGPDSPTTEASVELNGSLFTFGGAGKTLNKLGEGVAELNDDNGHNGTNVKGGQLLANVRGSLGTGSVNVENALLAYNAAQAAAETAQVLLNDGGQLDLGITPGANEHFVVGPNAAISGTGAQLTALSANRGGNLEIAPGAMISHKGTTLSLFDNNPQGLGTTPLFVYGISSDIPSNPNTPAVVEVGTGANSPWIGFGSDRFDRVFGSDPASGLDKIVILGDGQIRSLARTLTLNAALESGAAGSALTKLGGGALRLNNVRNVFRGAVYLQEGALVVNGLLDDVEKLEVHPTTLLGGLGRINGPVIFSGNSIVAPGDNTMAGHVGTLRTGRLTLADESLLLFDLGAPDETAEGQKDLLIVDGDLDLDGILQVVDLGNFGIGQYILMQASGLITDHDVKFGNLPQEFEYFISIESLNRAPAGGSVILNVVPEPATLGLLGLLAPAMLMRRRR